MTIDDFWKLIARVHRTVLKKGEGHDEAAIRPLVDALAALEKADLRSFQDHLAQALHDLDGRAYFDASADAAGSDDSFLYVRCFVVAMGQDTYQRTQLKPRLMPKTDGQWCEPLLYAAQSAWKKKTGEEVDFETKVSFESGSNEALWPPEKERDWREEAKAEIKRLRRDAKQARARAPGTGTRKIGLRLRRMTSETRRSWRKSFAVNRSDLNCCGRGTGSMAEAKRAWTFRFGS